MKIWNLDDERSGEHLADGPLPREGLGRDLESMVAQGIPLDRCPRCDMPGAALVGRPGEKGVCCCQRCRHVWLPVLSVDILRPTPSPTWPFRTPPTQDMIDDAIITVDWSDPHA